MSLISRAHDDVLLYEQLLPALADLDDLGAFLRVGKEHRAHGRHDHARVIALGGRAAFPDEPKLLNALAGALRALDLIGLAHAQAAESIALEPSLEHDRHAHAVRGYLMCEERRFDEALELGRALNRGHPHDSHVHLLMAWSGVMSGETAVAIEHARLANAHAADGPDIVAWLCQLRSSERESGSLRRLVAIDTVIDYIKRLRGQPIWEGSLAATAVEHYTSAG